MGIADGDPVPGIEAGRFLVADRIPRGSLFHKSVVLILEHGLPIACARAFNMRGRFSSAERRCNVGRGCQLVRGDGFVLGA